METKGQVWVISKTLSEGTDKLKILGVFENRFDAHDWMEKYFIDIFKRHWHYGEWLDDEDREDNVESKNLFNDCMNKEINRRMRSIKPDLDLWIDVDPIIYLEEEQEKSDKANIIEQERNFSVILAPFTYRMSTSQLYRH